MGQSVLQITMFVLIVCGRSITGTVSDDRIGKMEDEDSARSLHQQQIIINPSDDSCNVSTIRDVVSSELVDTTRRLEQLQTTVYDLVELVKNLPVPPITPVPPTQPDVHARDCSELLEKGVNTSGVYTIQPLDDGEPFDVYCDMETDGGGWTVFQKRLDGSVDFYHDWEGYRQRFGDLDGEFWLGNDNLHRLTAQGDYKLRVDLGDFEGNSRYAVYDNFNVADQNDNYKLTLGQYSGTAGNSFFYHNDMAFSTYDRDNDESGNCAEYWHSAWWFKSCHYVNLNAEYLGGPTDRNWSGIIWYDWKGSRYSLKTTSMKIKMKQ